MQNVMAFLNLFIAQFVDGQELCSSDATSFTWQDNGCDSGCSYVASVPESYGVPSDAPYAAVWPVGEKGLYCDKDEEVHQFGYKNSCNCHCDDLIDIESPPMLATTVSYLAQSLVTVIVGLNTAFRCRRNTSHHV